MYDKYVYIEFKQKYYLRNIENISKIKRYHTCYILFMVYIYIHTLLRENNIYNIKWYIKHEIYAI